MTPSTPGPILPDRPRRWPYYLAGAIALVALVAALSSGGQSGGYGERAGRYALTAADLDAAGAIPSADGGPRRWIADAGPVDFGQVFAVAAKLPGVGAPDDRHAAAFRAADGSEVFQVTALYDDPERAQDLVQSSAVGMLSSTFGLSSAPADVAGAADARRWSGSGFEGLSFRVDGAVVFVGARGPGAPAAAALAAVVRDRLAAAPPATATGRPATP